MWYNETKTQKTQMKQTTINEIKFGEKIAKKNVIVLLILVAFKAVIGQITGFVVLKADAISSLTDVVALFATYIGLRMSRKNADKNFQYGYHKVETLAALAVSLLILFFGTQVLIESYHRLFVEDQTQLRFLGIISVVITIAFTVRMTKDLEVAGKRSNSVSLLNNAKEKRLDIVMQAGVLMGVMADYFQIPQVEGLVGIIISALIFKEGFESARDALFYLLDYWDDPHLVREIEKTIEGMSKVVKKVKRVRLRRAGTWIFGEVVLEVSPFADIKDVRSEMNQIEKAILKLSPYLKEFLVFTKITNPDHIRVAVPVKENHGLNTEIANTMEGSPFLLLVDLKNKKIQKITRIENTYKNKDNLAQWAGWLKKKKVDIMINAEVDSLLFYVMEHVHNIRVYPKFKNIKTVGETIKLLLIDT